jgi:hypothetical protein
MYTYVMKGYTVGQTLTRRLLRTIMGIPGLLIDLAIGIFFPMNYSDYFNKGIWADKKTAFYLTYSDGTQVSMIRGITGYVGDLLGYVIGSVVGIILGIALFVPNSILSLFNWIIKTTITQVDAFAINIAESETFQKYFIGTPNTYNYMEKAYNTGSWILGWVLGAAPYLLCKLIEFFIPPIQDYLSSFIIHTVGVIGGVVTSIIAIAFYPLIYCLDKLCDLHDYLSLSVLKAIAFIYAKTDQEPEKHSKRDSCCPCLDNDTLHSPGFRKLVDEYKPFLFSKFFKGNLQIAEHQEVPPVVIINPGA